MKITVADARAFASALTTEADTAEASGAIDFDLVTSLQALDDQARAELQAAIAAAGAK